MVGQWPWDARPDAGHLQDEADVVVAHGPGLKPDNGPSPPLEINIQVERGIRGLHRVGPVKTVLFIKKNRTPPATIGPGLRGEGSVAIPLPSLPGLRQPLSFKFKVRVPLAIPS